MYGTLYLSVLVILISGGMTAASIANKFTLRGFVGADNHLHIFGVGYGVFLFIIRKENHLIVTYDPHRV